MATKVFRSKNLVTTANNISIKEYTFEEEIRFISKVIFTVIFVLVAMTVYFVHAYFGDIDCQVKNHFWTTVDSWPSNGQRLRSFLDQSKFGKWNFGS